MKTKIYLLSLVFFLGIQYNAKSQGVSINEDGSDPEASAILDLQSQDKGLLVPRMAQNQITDIQDPANGLIVFNTTDNKYYAFLEGENAWKEIAYGTSSMTPFVCGEALNDFRDGQSYTTVDINGQCWMAENLNIGTHTGSAQNNDGQITKSCMYNNPSYCDTHGGLYQWNEMMEYTTTEGAQGICPDGWHIPTDFEIFQMENFLDPAVNDPNQPYWRGNIVGGSMKETGYSHWAGPNTGATNVSGLTVFGAGYRSYSGSYYSYMYAATMWSSTQIGSNAFYRELSYTQPRVYRNQLTKNFFFSVRCVKD